MNSKHIKYAIIALCLAMVAAAIFWPHTPSTPAPTQHIAEQFTSPAGIHYGDDHSGRFDSRIAHVMAHTKPDPSKPKHSMFLDTTRDDVIRLLDEAWKKRGPPKQQGGAKGRDVYDVPMGRIVGADGEKHSRLVMERAEATIVTAYPVR